MKNLHYVLLLAPIIFLASCKDEHFRGEVTPSPDGKTYFGVLDNNGGQCGPLKVDGKVWPYAIGETAPIAPGEHTIECGTGHAFIIPPGVIFKFDYWGP